MNPFELYKVDSDGSPSTVAVLKGKWRELLKGLIPAAFLIEHTDCTSNIMEPMLEGDYTLGFISQILADLNAACVIVEKNYIDKAYLKDFQHYHLLCYQHH